jgi:hypothetical protein
MDKIHNEELNNLNSSSDIIRRIKSRNIRQAEHVARILLMRNANKILVTIPERKRRLGRRGEDVSIILKWALNELRCEN